jgi:hypothetical protein
MKKQKTIQKRSKSALAPSNAGAIGKRIPSTTTEINIKLLRPYPGNEELYGACSAEANAMLRRSLEAEGQRDPIHVLPPNNSAGLDDYTILEGHRRAEELSALGVPRVKVIIRHDLKHADAATVHQTYLSFNRDRRQLDGISLARNLYEQRAAERGMPDVDLPYHEERKVVESLSRLLGTVTRNAWRYVHAVRAPEILQAAHREGRLGLDDLSRAGMLPGEAQEQLAEELSELADPSKATVTHIVRRHLETESPRRGKRYTPIALRLIRNLRRDLSDLDGKFDRIYGPDLAPHREFLATAQIAIEELIVASKRPGSSIEEAFARAFATNRDDDSEPVTSDSVSECKKQN